MTSTETSHALADFEHLRRAYGTQADAAEGLGVAVRVVRSCETDPDYRPARRRLHALALVGLLTAHDLMDGRAYDIAGRLVD